MIVSEHSQEIKSVKFEAVAIDRQIEVLPLSDLHFGSQEFNLQLWKDTLAYIEEKPNRYVILNGDLIDNATRNSVSDIYSAMPVSPTEQILQVAKELKPIKDRIISVVSGNHEARSWKESGVDLTLWLCSELCIQDRYDPNMCIDFITIKNLKRRTKEGSKLRQFDSNYLITLNHRHGNAGGKKVGQKANSLQDMMNVIDCDIYVLGHSHQPFAFKQDFYRVDRGHKQVSRITKAFVNANAFLRFQGYGMAKGYTPSTMEVPRIIVRFSNAHRGNDLEIKLVV